MNPVRISSGTGLEGERVSTILAKKLFSRQPRLTV
jgi:hypothetical protein